MLHGSIRTYLNAIDNAFENDIDYAQLVKLYGNQPTGKTTRMSRSARLTNAFSKKFDNHCHALALYFAFYNFCRIHKSLKVPRQWLRA